MYTLSNLDTEKEGILDLEQFYEDYIDKVYKFFYTQCLNRHVAEDLTSQTFMLFMEQTQKNRTIHDNRKYLYGVMRNVWAGYLREHYAERHATLDDIENFEQYASEQVEEFETSTPSERILTYIDRLPKKQRLVVMEHLIAEKTTRQIAEELGKDKNYVKTTYKRGLASLRKIIANPLAPEGGQNV